MLGKRKAALQNAMVRVHDIIVPKWSLAAEHFEQKYTCRPPIDGLAVSLPRHNFGRQVVRRAANRVCLLGRDLGEAKVGNLDVSLESARTC